jgi:transcriptional regulator with XRE-family HTH domain
VYIYDKSLLGKKLNRLQLLGRELKFARMRRVMSMREIGEKVGTTAQTICNFESGRYVPGIDIIDAICQELDIDKDYIRRLLYHHFCYQYGLEILKGTKYENEFRAIPKFVCWDVKDKYGK